MNTKTKRKRGRQAVIDRQRIMNRDNGLCQICKVNGLLTIAYEVDHITPLHKGGSDQDDNKQALCINCHKWHSFLFF
jgi:5-methylcytosine-specific restriction protein A